MGGGRGGVGSTPPASRGNLRACETGTMAPEMNGPQVHRYHQLGLEVLRPLRQVSFHVMCIRRKVENFSSTIRDPPNDWAPRQSETKVHSPHMVHPHLVTPSQKRSPFPRLPSTPCWRKPCSSTRYGFLFFFAGDDYVSRISTCAPASGASSMYAVGFGPSGTEARFPSKGTRE